MPEKFVVVATMRDETRNGSLPDMPSARDCIRVELCIEPGSDPLAGWVLAANGQSRPFLGWLGLAAALERLLEESRAGTVEHEDAA
jgi:hypothetical protein